MRQRNPYPYPAEKTRLRRQRWARTCDEDARQGLYEAATGLLLCQDPSPYLPALYAAITRAQRLRRAQ